MTMTRTSDEVVDGFGIGWLLGPGCRCDRRASGSGASRSAFAWMERTRVASVATLAVPGILKLSEYAHFERTNVIDLRA